jgi:hypothetical protein
LNFSPRSLNSVGGFPTSHKTGAREEYEVILPFLSVNSQTKERIITLYNQGYSVRKISHTIEGIYQRERIREVLHENNVSLRGVSTQYKKLSELTEEEIECLMELLGCMYGDGSLSNTHGKGTSYFEAALVFAFDQADLVRRTQLITKRLYNKEQRVEEKDGAYNIHFKPTIAKEFAKLGFPRGKKSKQNVHLPLQFLSTKRRKIAFVRGFLNAEATINDTVSVQQSVRIIVEPELRELLKSIGKKYVYPKNSYVCWYVKWSEAKQHVECPQSNILIDLQTLLSDAGVHSAIYPVRVYIGQSGVISVHFELQILRQYLKRASDLQLVTCKKKQEKLNSLSGSARAENGLRSGRSGLVPTRVQIPSPASNN